MKRSMLVLGLVILLAIVIILAAAKVIILATEVFFVLLGLGLILLVVYFMLNRAEKGTVGDRRSMFGNKRNRF